MKRISVLLPLLVLAMSAQIPPKDRMVILISLDGFPGHAFDDPRFSAPHLRKLTREGLSARTMTPVNPTVTWPNHTSMVTGVTAAQHGVLYNGLAIRTGTQALRIEPWVDKSKLVRVPTVYDLAYQSGLTTAEIDWVAITNPRTITWSFGERPSLESNLVKEMIAAGEVTPEDITGFAKAGITWRDEVWLRAAKFLVRRHKPNLLMLHFLNTDSVQHRYGGGDLGAVTALALADARVGELYQAVKDEGMLDKTTFLIVSDHGFKTYTKRINANVALARKGLIRENGGKPEYDVQAVSEGGTAFVYINKSERREEISREVGDELSGLEGVERVIRPAEYDRIGLPLPSVNDQAPDLILAAKPGYAFGSAHSGELISSNSPAGSHGYLNDDPQIGAIFIASGYGIQKGRLERVSTLDVGPTVAALLGVKLTGAQGSSRLNSPK